MASTAPLLKNPPVPECGIELLTRSSPAASLDAAGQLLIEYGQFVASYPEISHFCFSTLKLEAANLPNSYLDWGGGALLALLDGQAMGFLAWRHPDGSESESAWEIKRLWVRPGGRGHGIAQGLMQTVEERAIHSKKTDLFLDTAPSAMPAAYRLYQQLGFVECPPWSGTAQSGIIYMRKNLPLESASLIL